MELGDQLDGSLVIGSSDKLRILAGVLREQPFTELLHPSVVTDLLTAAAELDAVPVTTN